MARSRINIITGKAPRPIISKPLAKVPKASKGDVQVKRPRRFHPGTVSKREIIKYQKSTTFFCPAVPFTRLIRSIMKEHDATLRFEKPAIFCIHEMGETYVIRLFHRANEIARHAGRDAVTVEDFNMAKKLDEVKF